MWLLKGKVEKCDLQKYLEEGTHQEVLYVNATVLHLEFQKFTDKAELRYKFEQTCKQTVADVLGNELKVDNVTMMMSPSSPLVQFIVAPPGGTPASTIDTALRAKAKELADTLGEKVRAIEGIKDVSQGGNVQVLDVTQPEVKKVYYPTLTTGKKHKIPQGVFNLCENTQIFGDLRSYEDRDIPALNNFSPEIEWALKKTGEAFKDNKLTGLFCVMVTNLLRQEPRSCNMWAAQLPPQNLMDILADNPNPDLRQVLDNASGVPRDILLRYASECKAVAALGIITADVIQQWTGECTADDRAFLAEASEKVGGAWTDFTVEMARGLWDRSSARYLILLQMVKAPPPAEGEDVALATLRKCPKDVLSTLFKAPWRGVADQESFFHLHPAFVKYRNVLVAEDMIQILTMAHTSPSSELVPALQNFAQDPTLSNRTKIELFVSFLSACRVLAASPEKLQETGGKMKKSKLKEELHIPDPTGAEIELLEAALREFVGRADKLTQGEDAASNEELALAYEAVLLLSTKDNLWHWGQTTVQNAPRAVKDMKRFLNTVAGKHISKVLREVSAGKKPYKYNDAASKELLQGSWKYDARKYGAFCDRNKEKSATEDFGQLLRMHIKLDLAFEGDGLWSFMQALEQEGDFAAVSMNKIAPKGSSLRLAIAQDVMKACGEGKLGGLQANEFDALMSYTHFFNPSLQDFVKNPENVRTAREAFQGVYSEELNPQSGLPLLLEAISKILNLKEGGQGEITVAACVTEIIDKLKAFTLCWRLFGKVINAVRDSSFKLDSVFSLANFQECAKEIATAGKVLNHKLSKAGAGGDKLLAMVERVTDTFLIGTNPGGWVSSLRSLDTVIFTLEYMGKEDLQLAYERFDKELNDCTIAKEMLLELLECVKGIYTKPLAGDGSSAMMGGDTDIKAFIKQNAGKLSKPVTWHGCKFESSDWETLAEIAGAAADAMQKKYNVLMLPHHTQLLTILMFGIRSRALKVPKEARAKELPETMLARVGTGEGKSLIIGMLAAFMAKTGLRAHVINNNRTLTRRDFATNDRFFRELGIQASSDPADLKNPKTGIVYCTGEDVEQTTLDALIEGEWFAHERELSNTVLIVDEVDGLIFDRGAVSSKLFTDRDLGDWVNEWLYQLRSSGRIERDYENFREVDEVSQFLQKEVEEAYAEAANKEEGKHFVVRSDKCYMLDPKTRIINEGAWALWLEILQSQKSVPASWVDYKYDKAILSRLQCFMSYGCIFGLTGSLGRDAEKGYLAQYYEAVTFQVPFFLDTCRSADGTVHGKQTLKVLTDNEPLKNRLEQERLTVQLAAQKCSTVPVLILAKDSDQVHRLVVQIKRKITELYGADGDAPAGGQAKGRFGRFSSPRKSGEGSSPRGASPRGGGSPRQGASPRDDKPAGADPPMSARWSSRGGPGGKQWGGGGPVGGGEQEEQTVITLLSNPKKPNEFVELVGKAMEPVGNHDDEVEGAPAKQKWLVTVTTAEGGRGHDYRVADPSIDDNGGLLLILTWVPASEREWIQMVGRTARQDHAGQYAVYLNQEEDDVKVGIKDRLSKEENMVQALLRQGDKETAKMLASCAGDIDRGREMHKLTSRFWALHKQDKTNKRQNWDWKELCREFKDISPQEIEERFYEIFPTSVSGEGLLKRTDGRRYEGGLKDGKPHGMGVFTMPDGTRFEGTWEEGKMHGKGKYYDPSGATYDGDWKNHEKSGHGIESYPDGARYEGEFETGCKHGVGKYTTGAGATYEGQFRKDKMDGHGHWEFVSGHKYTGQWKRGQMNGTGKMVWADGVTYEGRFENDVRHGRGTVRWPDGRVYRGHWHKGRLNGSGIMIDANGQETSLSQGDKDAMGPGAGGGGKPATTDEKAGLLKSAQDDRCAL